MLLMKERLPFAIQFAYTDLEQLGRDDWLNLQDDVKDFLGFRWGRTREAARQQARRVGVSPWPVSGQLIIRFTLDAIRTLQADVRQFLTSIMDRHSIIDRLENEEDERLVEQLAREVPPDIPEIRVKMWLDWKHGQPDDKGLLIDGDLRNLFLVTLGFLLNQDITHVQRCPECGRVFYRVRKQRYCSRRCTNRANMRAWRQSAHGKARESDLNHSRYQARVRRTVGPKATPDRRPTGARSKTQGGSSHGEGKTTRQP